MFEPIVKLKKKKSLPTNTSLNTYNLMRSERGRKKKRSHESNTLTYEHVTQYLQPNEK